MVLKDSGWDRKKLALEYGLKERNKKRLRQAGTELGQAQLKLGLDFTLIFCRFGFSPFGLIELV